MPLIVFEQRFYTGFVILSVLSCLSYSIIPGGVTVATYVIPITSYFLLFVTWKEVFFYQRDKEIDCRQIVWLLLFWNICIIARGLWDASDYWDYRGLILSRIPALLLPIVIFIGGSMGLMARIYSALLKIYIPLSLLIIKPIFYQVISVPLLFIIPYIPFLARRWYKYLFVVFLLLAINLSARAWTLRLAVAIILLCVYRFRKKDFSLFFYRILFCIMVATPLLFVILGYTGRFNILNMDSYLESNTDKIPTIDTRSHLYRLVEKKLTEEDKNWCGLGGISEYWEGFYADYKYSDNKGFSQKGRDSTEAGLLNMYLYGGFIGAILYSLLYISAAYKAFFSSCNFASKLLGLFVLFRWIISFIDEPESRTVSMIILYLTIGLCLSRQFRRMSDTDFKTRLNVI